jgi:hypothetical protein
MAKYLDTGSGATSQYAGHWLTQNLVPGIRGFRAQFGYFRYSALAPFAGTLQTAANAGYPVHVVLGSNSGSLLAADVQRILRIFAGPAATVTVVAFSDGEFHPKTIHLTRANASTAALVGSSNLTLNGLGLNVEASIVLDTSLRDDATVIHLVAQAVERWHGFLAPGVFPINSDADIQALVDANIINLPQPVKPTAGSRTRRRTALGRRTRSWIAGAAGGGPLVPALIPPPPITPPPVAPALAAPAVAPVVVAATGIISHQWCKELASSDAQRVRPGSNPTGKLRLTESGFPINHQTWFRSSMFGGVPWRALIKNGNNYEQATIPFNV